MHFKDLQKKVLFHTKKKRKFKNFLEKFAIFAGQVKIKHNSVEKETGVSTIKHYARINSAENLHIFAKS